MGGPSSLQELQGRAEQRRHVRGRRLAAVLLQQGEHDGFVPGEARPAADPLEHPEQAAVQEGLDHRRMHVILAAGGGAVPQAQRHLLDRGDHCRLRVLRRLRGPCRSQQRRRLHRARPGAEVLGREVLPHGLAHVGVHVPRADGFRGPFLVVVLEQLVAGDIAALTDDAGQARVLHLDRVGDPALPLEAEVEALPDDFYVLVAHGSEPVRLVLLHVGRVPDADERRLQQAHHRGQHLLPGEPG